MEEERGEREKELESEGREGGRKREEAERGRELRVGERKRWR